MINIADRLPESAKAWYMAARPRSLTATYAPLLVGAAVAFTYGAFDLLRFVLALIGALLLQIGANLVNEYVDFTRGTDAHKTDGMGMVLTKSKQLTPEQVRLGAVLTIGGGALIGLLLMFTSGPLLLLIGLGGVLVAVLYTAGPYPLAYIGLGEPAAFIFMGPLMTLGTFYAVSRGQFSWAAVLAGLPIAFTVANILHANNMRDYEADKLANKRTLAVRFGMAAARQEFAALAYAPYVVTVLFVLLQAMPWTTLLVFATLPEAVRLVRLALSAENPAALHRVQGLSAQLHLRVGLALTGGWLLFGVISQFFAAFRT